MDKDLLLHLIQTVQTDVKRIEEKFDEQSAKIEGKVDQLLEFKWQIVGGSVVGSIIVTVLIQILSSLFK